MQYNVNNPSVKRILREVKEMEAEPSDQYTAAPLEDNIFEWHFTIRGPKDTEFEGGLYHGRIILPPEYPFKPPNIVLLNESGRFEVGTKICLSISSYHPEHWQPSWSIRTVLVALISFMPTKGDGAIGALDMAPNDRKVLAKKSPNFLCEKCGKRMCDLLNPIEPGAEKKPETTESTTTTTTTTTTTSSSENAAAPPLSPSPAITTTQNTSTTPSIQETNTSPNNNNNNNNTFSPAPVPTPSPSPSVNYQLPPQQLPSFQPPSQPQFQPQPQQPVYNRNAAMTNNNAGFTNNNVQPAQLQQQQQQQVMTNENVHNSAGNLDYIILALLFAIIGLLAKKFYGL